MTKRGVPQALFELFLTKQSADKRSRDAKCIACGRTYSQAKVQQLFQHLKKCDKSDQDKVEKILRARESYVEGKLEVARDEAKKFEITKQVDKLLADVIAKNALPISLVSCESFKRMMNPRYKIPSRKKFSVQLLHNIELRNKKWHLNQSEAPRSALQL